MIPTTALWTLRRSRDQVLSTRVFLAPSVYRTGTTNAMIKQETLESELADNASTVAGPVYDALAMDWSILVGRVRSSDAKGLH